MRETMKSSSNPSCGQPRGMLEILNHYNFLTVSREDDEKRKMSKVML